MSATVRPVLLIAAVLCSSVIAVHRWKAAAPVADSVSPMPAVVSAPVQATLDSALDDAIEMLADSDPFRLANRPSLVRYDPIGGGSHVMQPAVAVAPMRPVMTLKAIVGGPPWQAVVDGIPGQPAGTLVRAGNTFDKLIVRGVSRDSVVIQGPDTSWVLSFRSRR